MIAADKMIRPPYAVLSSERVGHYGRSPTHAMSLQQPTQKAEALIEALPYLQAFRGKTFLIKMGGSAMEDPELVRKVMRDVVFLEVAGINPIIVHGGGKAISSAMKAAGLEAEFIGGFRRTTDEAISIVEKVLTNEINPRLVQMIREFGGKATGISGTDVFLGEKMKAKDGDGNPVDIGRVGEVVGCQLGQMDSAHKASIVPVISPLAAELATGKPLNINADLAAAALAKELRVTKLVYLSDVPGLMKDPSDPSTLIKSVNREQAEGLLADGTISGGMIPKIRSAMDALNAGVRKVHFIDGRLPHAMLLEIFTDYGIGTEVTR
jgi:acetylglutamate kinase